MFVFDAFTASTHSTEQKTELLDIVKNNLEKKGDNQKKNPKANNQIFEACNVAIYTSSSFCRSLAACVS